MKIPLILSLLIGGAVGSKVINDNIINNTKQEVIVEDKENNSDILTAYIDGENKVYLNDINNSEVVEDTWNYNEVKSININANLSQFDASDMYLEIDVPVGFKLSTKPESLLGETLVDLDKSEFGKIVFPIESGDGSLAGYTSNSGKLRYKISPFSSHINLDFLMTVDYSLWDGVQDTISPNGFDLEISVCDSKLVESKKIDNIYIYPENYSGFYWQSVGDETILEGVKQEFSTVLFLSNNSRLFRNLTVEMEKPYFEKNINGVVVKEYLDILNINPGNNGVYSETSDSIIFSWDKFYGRKIDGMSFSMELNDVSIPHKAPIKWAFKDFSYCGTLSNNENIITNKHKSSNVVFISSEVEDISFKSHTKDVYKPLRDNETISHIGRIDILNNGKETGRKFLSMEFPVVGVGVKSLRMPALPEPNQYYLDVILWNKRTGEEYSESIIINKPKTSSFSTGYIINIDEILDIIGNQRLIIDSDNIFIKSLAYEMGSLPSRYNSGSTWYSTDSGNIYGKVFDNADISKYYIKAELSDLDDPLVEPIKIESTISVSSKGTTNAVVKNQKIVNSNNIEVSEIMAGEPLHIKGNLYIPNYYYHNSNFMSDIVFYIKLPKAIKINENSSYFNYLSYGEKRKIDFSIPNINNPRELSDGMLLYKIKIPDDIVLGLYNVNLGNVGTIEFSLSLDVSKSMRTKSIKIDDTIFIGDEYIEMGTGTSSSEGVRDVWDVDDDGNKDELFVSFYKKTINIISNSNWLDTGHSIEVSGALQTDSNLIINNSNDTIKYNINIDNSNEGHVRPGNFEYYIPIPKKDLEYNSNIKDKDEVFNFNMVLNEKVADVTGFEITYSYDNINFVPYSAGLDLSKVSMVRIVNTEDINPNDQLQFSVNMNYEEGSWDGSSGNDVIWSAYGNQVYEKNGGESGYLHVMDKIKLEIVKAPIIKENLVQVTANVNDRVSLDAVIDLGIPLANIKWQYRTSSTGPWIDLSEPSKTLTLENIDYSMNGYQYRYEALNKGGSVTSNIATLIVIDNSAPIIKLTETRDGENYKIRIDVTDEDNGVSHIILPDGTRIDGDTYTIDAEPNVKYVFKAYDLAGNESIADMTIVNGLAPGRVTSNLDIYIKSENMLSLSLNSNSISFEDFNGTEDLEKPGAIELSMNSSLPYEINAYLEEEIQNADKSETMDKSILNLKESSDTDYKEFVDIKTKLNLVSHNDAGNNKLHTFDFKLNGGIAHKKGVYKATIKFEVKQK